MKTAGFLALFAGLFLQLPAQMVKTPDQVYGELFRDVQMARIFPDSKTFVDCIPKRNPEDIVKDYLAAKNNPALRFSLELFVKENFELPAPPKEEFVSREKDIVAHIKQLWPMLKRTPDKAAEGSSLLPLPYPYIVPGGRFREIYYWDSYFTMLGLKESGETGMIEDMIRNFAFLIDTYGHIPNGNRTYYVTRSQPPFFAAMIQLLASIKGDEAYTAFLPNLEKEYKFWMDGSENLKPGQVRRRVVRLKGGEVLNRYWDDDNSPRQESYREDVETAGQSGRNKAEIYRHLRAAAESGFDFSNRWFADGKKLTSIQTTDLVAVDLNALLYNLEMVIAKGRLLKGDEKGASEFRAAAERRLKAINKYCWNEQVSFYTDYNFKSQKAWKEITPAGLYPFCFFDSNPGYMSLLAQRAAVAVKAHLLQPGGLTTTKNNTGQQWDSPNGWAPLQWMSVWGLDRCGQKELARDIAQRWIKLNYDVFQRTGKLMEKYNVVDVNAGAGGGEYPGQDGFGWTNGVLLALIARFGTPK